MSRFLFAVAALAAAAGLSPAAASVPRDAGTRIVRYADLDLSSAAGRARLEQRIGAAVRAVCGDAAAGDLRSTLDAHACRAATAAHVVRPAGAPALAYNR
jgi:UrcA family protein